MDNRRLARRGDHSGAESQHAALADAETRHQKTDSADSLMAAAKFRDFTICRNQNLLAWRRSYSPISLLSLCNFKGSVTFSSRIKPRHGNFNGNGHMPSPPPNEITQILLRWSRGDQAALDQLMPVEYEELHKLAHSYMRREQIGRAHV